MARYYVAHGSVRGTCGHRHRTIAAATRCVAEDGRGCRGLGGGAYSDRGVRAVELAGVPESLSAEEESDLDAFYSTGE